MVLFVIGFLSFFLGALSYKNRIIHVIYHKIILLIKRGKTLQKVTAPESKFNNNFNWKNYSYTKAYLNIEKFLYESIKDFSLRYDCDKIGKKEFLNDLRGNMFTSNHDEVSLIKKDIIKETDLYVIEKLRMNTEFNKKIEFDMLFAYAKPINQNIRKNKTIIMLNGFSSSPEKILGLEKTDYSKKIGKIFLENGYDIIAPFMFNHGDRLSNIAGLLSLTGSTLEWFEVNKVLSSIDFIRRSRKIGDNEIGIYGISGGGRIAMYTAAIDKRIKSVVASCIVQDMRKSLLDYASRKNQFNRKDYSMRFHYYVPKFPFYYKYTFPSISELIAPRSLRIECGSDDKILFDYEIENECSKIKNIYSDKNNESNFSFSIHPGGHEANPEGTLAWIGNNL